VIAAPNGALLAGPVADRGSEILYADCDLAAARDKRVGAHNDAFGDRRSEHYLGARGSRRVNRLEDGPRYAPADSSARPASPASGRSRAARTSRTSTASTSRRWGSRSTPARAFGPARASVRRRSAKHRCCCDRGIPSSLWTCSPRSGRRLRRYRHHPRQCRAHDRPDRRRPWPVRRTGGHPIVLGGDHLDRAGELPRSRSGSRPTGACTARRACRHVGRVLRRAVLPTGLRFGARSRRGCWRPSASLLAGMRGPLYSAGDLDQTREMGFEVISATSSGR